MKKILFLSLLFCFFSPNFYSTLLAMNDNGHDMDANENPIENRENIVCLCKKCQTRLQNMLQYINNKTHNIPTQTILLYLCRACCGVCLATMICVVISTVCCSIGAFELFYFTRKLIDIGNKT